MSNIIDLGLNNLPYSDVIPDSFHEKKTLVPVGEDQESHEFVSSETTKVKEKEKVRLLKKKMLQVLIAEDSPVNLMIIKKNIISSAKNCDIDIAENGEIAVKKAKEKEYDLIITDQYMPYLSGSKAVEQIRIFNSTVKIVVQSDAEKSDLQKAFLTHDVTYLEGGKLKTISQLNNLLISLKLVKDPNEEK
jgi:CheY-like chemotaxis protein